MIRWRTKSFSVINPEISEAQVPPDVRGNFYANRVVDQWNGLPDSVVLAPSINAFKSCLDKHWSNLPSLYDPLYQSSR